MVQIKMFDRVFLTRKQVIRLGKGKLIKFRRAKHVYILGL